MDSSSFNLNKTRHRKKKLGTRLAATQLWTIFSFFRETTRLKRKGNPAAVAQRNFQQPGKTNCAVAGIKKHCETRVQEGRKRWNQTLGRKWYPKLLIDLVFVGFVYFLNLFFSRSRGRYLRPIGRKKMNK